MVEEEVPSARALGTALSPCHANDRRQVAFHLHLRRRVPSVSLGQTCTGGASSAAAVEREGRESSAHHWTRCACNPLDDVNEAIHVVCGRAVRAEVMRETEHSKVRVDSPLDLDQRLNG
jgi:hypothetical protein